MDDELTDRSPARLEVSAAPAGSAGEGRLVLRLAGDLDLAGVGDLTDAVEALLRRPPQPVEIDLADVAFLDSSGVALLIRVANHFGRVRTRAATPPVDRVIEVLGLADRLGLDGR